MWRWQMAECKIPQRLAKPFQQIRLRLKLYILNELPPSPRIMSPGHNLIHTFRPSALRAVLTFFMRGFKKLAAMGTPIQIRMEIGLLTIITKNLTP